MGIGTWLCSETYGYTTISYNVPGKALNAKAAPKTPNTKLRKNAGLSPAENERQKRSGKNHRYQPP